MHRAVFFSMGILDIFSSSIIYPFLKIQHAVVSPVKNYFDRKKTIQELEVIVNDLRAQKEELLANTIKLASSFQFIQETQELSEFSSRYQSSYKRLAYIMLRQCSDQAQWYLIDLGSVHGVKVDMVAVYKNCLVGRITEVHPYYSKITLITDSSCKVAALCPTTQAQGIYEGMNDYEVASLNYVSHLQSLHKNDLVISSGEGTVFPRGFGLGTIKYFDVDQVVYTVRLAPLIDVRSLTYCYIIQKGEYISSPQEQV